MGLSLRTLAGPCDLTLAKGLDECGLHDELDQIKGEEPDEILREQVSEQIRCKRSRTYSDPDNADPCSGDGVDLGEAPVGIGGDDGGDDLGDDEGTEGSGGTLHEEEAMRTGDGNLEIEDHVELVVVDVLAAVCLSVRERDTELVLKEGSLDDDNDRAML